MEGLKRTAGYAESQIRVLLSELKGTSHTARLKAIAAFHKYIKTYLPEVYDDDVDFLYTGLLNGADRGPGLLSYCGLDSEKHNGQLKRIAGPVISLVRWLVTCQEYEDENIFYDRFVSLSENFYKQINFVKHIVMSTNDGTGSSKQGARQGSSEDANILLSIIYKDHRNSETGELERLDLTTLVADQRCREKFMQWLQKTTTQQSYANLRGMRSKTLNSKVNRPNTWDSVHFKPIPVQEGEEGEEIDIEEVTEDPPIIDPLGISTIDLRITQEAYMSGNLALPKLRGSGGDSKISKRNSMEMADKRVQKFNLKQKSSRKSMSFAANVEQHEKGKEEKKKVKIKVDNDDSDESSAHGSDNEDAATAAANVDSEKNFERSVSFRRSMSGINFNDFTSRRFKYSVIPREKNFSPGLFLSLVHHDTSYQQLYLGLVAIESKVKFQSGQRNDLIRSHYGVFIECVDGLEWLKRFLGDPSSPIPIIPNKRGSMAGKRRSSILDKPIDLSSGNKDLGKSKLAKSQDLLKAAKDEANKTLKPILDSMEKSRLIHSVEKILSRYAVVLDYPTKIKKAYETEDFQEVLSLYQSGQKYLQNPNGIQFLYKIRDYLHTVLEQTKSKCLTMIMANPNERLVISTNGEIETVVHLSSPNKTSERKKITTAVNNPSTAAATATPVSSSSSGSTKTAQSIQSSYFQPFQIGNNKIESVLKYARILRDSDGEDEYREVLRKSFYKHVSYLYEDLSDIIKVFQEGVAKEYSQLSQGTAGSNASTPARGTSSPGKAYGGYSSLGEYEKESMKDFIGRWNLLSSSIASTASATTASTSAAGIPLMSPSMGNSRKSQKSSTAFDFDGFGDESTVTEDEFSVIFNYDEREDKYQQYPREEVLAVEHAGGLASDSYSDQDDIDRYDTVVSMMQSISSVKLRIQHFQRLLDSMKLWIPFLFRIVVELTTQSVNSKVAQARSANNSTARGQILSKVLNSILTIYSKLLQHVIYGTNLGKPLMDLIQPLQGISTNQGTQSRQNNPLRASISLDPSKANIMLQSLTDPWVLSSGLYSTSLPEYYQLHCCLEISQFYDQLEILLSSSSSTANTTSSGYLPSQSIYYDSLSQLRDIAREGSVLLSQRMIDRLVELILTRYSLYYDNKALDDSSSRAAAGAAGNLTTKNGKLKDYIPLKLELMGKQFHSLVFDAIQRLHGMLRRPDWVCTTVLDGIVRAIATFMEILKSRSVSTDSVSSANQFSALRGSINTNGITNRRRTGSSAVTSPTYVKTGIDLSLIENDLKAPLTSPNQSSANQFDLLRCLVQLRTFTSPKLWSLYRQLYLDVATVANNANSFVFGSNKGSSDNTILNRLFVSTPSTSTGGNSSAKPSVTTSLFTKTSILTNDASLTERIQDTYRQLFPGSNEANNFIAMVGSVASLEDTTIDSIINDKVSNIRSGIFSFYRALIKGVIVKGVKYGNQVYNAQSLPNHLAKLLLAVGYEKTNYRHTMHRLTLEFGLNVQSYAPTTGMHPYDEESVDDQDQFEMSDSEADERDEDDGDSDREMEVETNQMSKSLRIHDSNTILYENYLFQRLCVRVVVCFQELVDKLNANTLFAESASASTDLKTPPAVLRQAQDEFEYLKSVIRVVVPSDARLQPALPITQKQSQKSEQAKSFLDADRLQELDVKYKVLILR